MMVIPLNPEELRHPLIHLQLSLGSKYVYQFKVYQFWYLLPHHHTYSFFVSLSTLIHHPTHIHPRNKKMSLIHFFSQIVACLVK